MCMLDFELAGDYYAAKYWKNENAVCLTDGTSHAFANAIYVK